MALSRDEYRSKVLGCWLGKNIGGTLGAPFEWRRQVNDVSFYTQDLGGEPLPNDDLDLQLLWLVALEERGVELDAHTLADYWLLYITPHWSEYGTAKANLRSGLMPPLSGTYRNDFKDSCGAFIRSEIWACLAPGAPQVAARYAYEDAIVDHGDGEGSYAEAFCAAMESAAFVLSDLERLIEIGLSYIPENCGVSCAARMVRDAYAQGLSWREARDRVLEEYRGSAFMNNADSVSPEDRAKGFVSGKLGWDVPSNIAMLLIGLLYGGGDFGKSICTAVNCGEDTDCTGATAGALFGILHGAEGIPEPWVKPIGHGIRTLCLNLGELGGCLPATVEELTDRTERAMLQAAARRGLAPYGPREDVGPEALKAGPLRYELWRNLGGPVFRFDRLRVAVDYGGEGPVLSSDRPKTVGLRIRNVGKAQTALTMRVHAPDGWEATPKAATLLALPGALGESAELTLTVTAEGWSEPSGRAVVEIAMPGWPQVAYVPIVLLNGG